MDTLEFRGEFGSEKVLVELAYPGDALYGVPVEVVSVFFSDGDVHSWHALEELESLLARRELLLVPCRRSTEMLFGDEQLARVVDFAHGLLAARPIKPGPPARPSSLGEDGLGL